jgi:hypothetical protein
MLSGSAENRLNRPASNSQENHTHLRPSEHPDSNYSSPGQSQPSETMIGHPSRHVNGSLQNLTAVNSIDYGGEPRPSNTGQ